MGSQIIELLRNRGKTGSPLGMYSACTANEYVIEAVMEENMKYNMPVLIEATANQCNQYGGYTGMTPNGFACFIKSIAKKIGLPQEKIILGGDHLGPLTWQNEPEKDAMKKSEELVKEYVLAGFTKIHIDTSMRLKDDSIHERLSEKIIADRAVRLIEVCEKAYLKRREEYPKSPPLAYVIGSEVPIPGGAQETEDSVAVTKPYQFESTYETFRLAFEKKGLSEAFERVIAVVVQPGVEFGDDFVVEYDRKKAKDLTEKLNEYPNLVFEGHSTDYQPPQKLREMTEDGVAILKVGPALTFYFKEAVFALAEIEKELELNDQSRFKEVLDETMVQHNENWIKHYHGTEKEISFKRKYSLSDRSRYYFPNSNVRDSLLTLLRNINKENLPISIISQYLPSVLMRLQKENIPLTAENMIKARIKDCIDTYMYAVLPDTNNTI